MGKDNFFRHLSRWKNLVAFAVMMACFLSVFSFLAAVTPEQSGGKMPANWSAGVMNHGHYYEWYTIADRPRLFTGSCIGLVASTLYLWGSIILACLEEEDEQAKR